jgi:ATP-dependent Zn protease
MSHAKRMSLSVKLAVVLACVASALGVFASGAVAAKKAPPPANTETLAVFEKQLEAGEIKSATVRSKSHSLHLNLSNGHHADLLYAPSEAKKLRAELKAHNVSVVKKSPGHKLRYIVGGIVIVVVVILLIAGFVLVRRRRATADNY